MKQILQTIIIVRCQDYIVFCSVCTENYDNIYKMCEISSPFYKYYVEILLTMDKKKKKTTQNINHPFRAYLVYRNLHYNEIQFWKYDLSLVLRELRFG